MIDRRAVLKTVLWRMLGQALLSLAVLTWIASSFPHTHMVAWKVQQAGDVLETLFRALVLSLVCFLILQRTAWNIDQPFLVLARTYYIQAFTLSLLRLHTGIRRVGDDRSPMEWMGATCFWIIFYFVVGTILLLPKPLPKLPPTH